jgi:hypothetical protein
VTRSSPGGGVQGEAIERGRERLVESDAHVPERLSTTKAG